MAANPLFRRGRGAARRVLTSALLVVAFLGLAYFQAVGAAEPGDAEPTAKLAAFTAPQLIRAALRRLDGESTNIQIQGRALTPEEKSRLKVLAKTIAQLQEVLKTLEAEGQTRPR